MSDLDFELDAEKYTPEELEQILKLKFPYSSDDIEEELKKITYNVTENAYVGVNELVLTSTINRCLEQVYNLQLTVQELLQEKSINVYPLITQVIDLDI